MSGEVRQYVIYERPADCPESFVVREWVITSEGATPSDRAWVAATLEGARLWVPPQADVCLPRVASDDPVIVETWM